MPPRVKKNASSSNAASGSEPKPVKMGRQRRKSSVPRKNCQVSANTWDDNGVPFIDEQEWQQRKTCCDVLYEGIALPGALLIDSSQFKGCAEHDKKQPASQNDADVKM